MAIRKVDSNVKVNEEEPEAEESAKPDMSLFSENAFEEDDAEKGERLRKDVGKTLTVTLADGKVHELMPMSILRQDIWGEYRSIGSIGAPSLRRDASMMIWLCLNSPKLINMLVYQTQHTRPIYDPKTGSLIKGPVVLDCPLWDAVNDFADEQYSGPGGKEREQQMIDVSNIMADRIAAVQMEADVDPEDEDDDEDETPGKPPQASDGPTQRASAKKRTSPKKKRSGKSASTKA